MKRDPDTNLPVIGGTDPAQTTGVITVHSGVAETPAEVAGTPPASHPCAAEYIDVEDERPCGCHIDVVLIDQWGEMTAPTIHSCASHAIPEAVK